jgi:hypothetical protein
MEPDRPIGALLLLLINSVIKNKIGRTGALTETPNARIDAWRIIQRRAADLGAPIDGRPRSLPFGRRRRSRLGEQSFLERVRAFLPRPMRILVDERWHGESRQQQWQSKVCA